MAKPNPLAQGQQGTYNPARGVNASLQGGGGFNNFSAGNKQYGLAGGQAPNRGATMNRTGYAARDARIAAERAALEQQRKGLI